MTSTTIPAVTSVLVESSGAQVAPRVGDPRTKLSTFHALLCADADQRAKQPVYAELASNLRIIASPVAS